MDLKLNQINQLVHICLVLCKGSDNQLQKQNESDSWSVTSDSLWPHGLYSPWNSLGWNTGVGGLFPSPGDLPNPGIEPRSPALQADSLPAEPQGKPENTEVGSLSLLQGIFPTQESNWGLLHCRQILYQLSYEGSPNTFKSIVFQVNIKSISSLSFQQKNSNFMCEAFFFLYNKHLKTSSES